MAVPQNVTELNQALHSRLCHVEALIKEILQCKKNVMENTAQVKEQINSAFRGEAAVLEQRKAQLSQQVDVLASRQDNRLQADLAKLYQYQGQLRSLLSLSESQQLSFCFSIRGIPEMPRVATTTDELRFTCDHQLHDRAETFGSVEVDTCFYNSDLDDCESLGHTPLLHKDSGREDCSCSDSKDPWLMYHVGDRTPDDDFEVVGGCLPKSPSATSSSIEAVSMDEDECLEKPVGITDKNSLVEQESRPRKSLSDLSAFYEDNPAFWLLGSKGGPASSTKLHGTCRPGESTFLDRDRASVHLHDHLYSLTLKNDDGSVGSSFNSADSDRLSWLLSSNSGTLHSSSSSTLCSDAASKAAQREGSTWLLPPKTSRTDAGLYGTKIKEMFSVYLDNTDNAKWILSGKMA